MATPGWLLPVEVFLKRRHGRSNQISFSWRKKQFPEGQMSHPRSHTVSSTRLSTVMLLLLTAGCGCLPGVGSLELWVQDHWGIL